MNAFPSGEGGVQRWKRSFIPAGDLSFILFAPVSSLEGSAKPAHKVSAAVFLEAYSKGITIKRNKVRLMTFLICPDYFDILDGY